MTRGFVLTLLLGLVLIGFALLVNAASYAYGRLGLSAGWAIAILTASIVGSLFNIPVAHLQGNTYVHRRRGLFPSRSQLSRNW